MSPHNEYFLAPKSLPNGDIRGQLLPPTNLALHFHPRVRHRRGAKDVRGVLVAPKRHTR